MGQYSATFRPVRDASVQHQLYGASTAWEALDDIEADNNSTYIFQPGLPSTRCKSPMVLKSDIRIESSLLSPLQPKVIVVVAVTRR